MNKTRIEIAKARSIFYRTIRDFFDNQGYIETETPILSPSLIPESSIEIFETHLNHFHRDSDKLYLVPSPEFFMKILLSEGFGDIYQITKCFRNAENYSPKHYCEFSMLEWYALNKDYKDNIKVQKDLLKALAPTAADDTRHLFENFSEITVTDLMQEYARIDLNECSTFEEFKEHASACGYEDYANVSSTWEELFDRIFISHAENKLPEDKTVFLKDYPAQIPTTAKRNGNFYERWEFYMKGWEMANCYTEEARYEEMKNLFQEEEKAKNKMITPHKVDYDYLDIFKGNFPVCSGVALGIDRLFAIYMNAGSLDDISLFPFSNIMN